MKNQCVFALSHPKDSHFKLFLNEYEKLIDNGKINILYTETNSRLEFCVLVSGNKHDCSKIKDSITEAKGKIFDFFGKNGGPFYIGYNEQIVEGMEEIMQTINEETDVWPSEREIYQKYKQNEIDLQTFFIESYRTRPMLMKWGNKLIETGYQF